MCYDFIDHFRKSLPFGVSMKKIILFFLLFWLNAQNITDLLNRKVNIPDKVKKVIAIGPGALRLVVYLNSKNKVIGIEKREKKYIYARAYIVANKELLKLPVIGMGGVNANINLEKIISLKPDVIIAAYISKKMADLIEKKTKIPVVVVSYGNLGTFANGKLFKSIMLLGKILNKQKRAVEVINFIKKMDGELKNKTISCKEKIYIGAVAFKGLHGITSTIPKFPPFMLLGVKNGVNLDVSSQIFISKEELLRLNPDIIFIDESGLKFVKNFKLLKYLKAYKNHKIYGILPYNNYMTNIGSAYADTYYIGKILNPDKFKNIDIEKKADEIYKFLVGKACYKEIAKFFGGFKKLY